MRNYYLIFFFFITPFISWAQLANDSCFVATPINVGDCGVYNNVGALTNVSSVSAWTSPGLSCTPHENEVWFSYVQPATGAQDLQITVTGMADGGIPAMNQPRVAVLFGVCDNNFQLFNPIDCDEADAGSNTVQFNIQNSTPGATYYIIVSDWSATGGNNEGAFELCLEEYTPPADVCSSSGIVTDCEGELFDTGGTDMDYGPNENCVVTISPAIANSCIEVFIDYFNLENNADFLNFYDGTSINDPLIGSYTGVGAQQLVQASSGSVTIEFISDANIQESGFELSWNCSSTACDPLGLIAVDENASIQDLVDALSSPQVIVENPVLNCPDGAYGTYNSPNNTQLDVMGLGSGIVLSTGLVDELENNEAFFASESFNTPGDVDLDFISPNNPTEDACVLVFDVYAATDKLQFNYVFGSEEYPNFTCSDFNDIFAFFISGPDPNGGFYANDNIAVLEDNITEVSINTVNNSVNEDPFDVCGSPLDPTTEEVIYVDNDGGESLPFGGYTAVLTAQADVIPCNYYTLKLAIADRGDGAFDSSVFIADLEAGLPQVDVEFAINSVDGENILVEGCSNGSDQITASILNENLDTFVYYLQVEGTADTMLDLSSSIPDSLVAPPGLSNYTIGFEPAVDNIDEGVESIEISLYAIFDCDTVWYDSIPINIYDHPDIEPTLDTFFVCPGTSVQLDVSGATAYTWTWPDPSEINDPNISNPILTPSQSGYIYVDGIVNANINCIDNDSAYIQIIDPAILAPNPQVDICENGSIMLDVTTNTANTGISWLPEDGLSCTDCPNPIASPATTTVYTATVTAGGCTASTDITVTVSPLAVPDIIADAQICEGSSILLANAPTGPGVGITNYQWTPDNGSLDDPTSPTPTATPDTTTTYTVVSSSDTGICFDTMSVTISVDPATIDIMEDDTLYQCNDALSPVTLNASSIVADTDISWMDSNGTIYPNGASLTANPTEDITYYATITFQGCTNTDSVHVQIDSLPSLALDVAVPTQGIQVTNPDTVDVCGGVNESFFVTNIYNTLDFPEIQHEWLVDGASFSPPQNGPNIFNDLPLTTTTYTLETVNNACATSNTFVIDVNTPPNFAITSPADTICVGESIQLEASGSTTGYTWEPNDGSLSDINVSNPIATPTQTTTYTAYSDVAGCLAGVSKTITVIEQPSINLIDDISLCTGGSINLGLDATNPDWTYTWSPNNFVSGDGTANPTAAPISTTTYSVTVSNQGYCEVVESVTINIIGNLPLTVTGDTEVCAGETAVISANTSGAVNWYDDAGNLLNNGPVLNYPTTTAGTFTFTVEAFNSLCTVSETVTLTVHEVPTVSATADTNSSCSGAEVNLSATTDVGTLSWAPANEFTDPTLANQVVNPNGTTTYTATATSNGCSASDEVTINVSDAPFYAVLDDVEICLGNSVEIGLVGGGDTEYAWTATPADPSLDADSPTPDVSPTETTEYILTATNGNCTEMDTVVVTVYDPTITVANDANGPVCQGEEVVLTANVSPAGGTITWRNPQGDEVGTGTPFPITANMSNTFTATYNIGGCFASASTSVEVEATPNLSITASNPDITIGDNTDITVSGAPQGSDFAWSPEGGNAASINVAPLQTTTYTVTVTTPAGCEYVLSQVIDVTLIEFEMPNVLTPNGDEINDGFFPAYSPGFHEIIEFKVFDRWGELVHEDNTTAWLGTHNNEDLPADVYVYFVKIRYTDGTVETRKGDVTLIR